MTNSITVTSIDKAWAEVNKIFPTDYEKDYYASDRAGYPIYRHRELNHYSKICDLGIRLEVLTGEYGENVTNIWIEEKPKKPLTFVAVVTYQIHNGKIMTTEIKGVEKVESCFEKINNEILEVLKVRYSVYKEKTWLARSIIDIKLTAETA